RSRVGAKPSPMRAPTSDSVTSGVAPDPLGDVRRTSARATLDGRGTGRFRLSSWTVRSFTPSCASCSSTSACRRSPTRCRLRVLAQGGLVCASAAAVAERMPPPNARPEPIDLAVGDERGIDDLVEELALAGYERVERAEERGHVAVRGGLVDVFPTTGREPLR